MTKYSFYGFQIIDSLNFHFIQILLNNVEPGQEDFLELKIAFENMIPQFLYLKFPSTLGQKRKPKRPTGNKNILNSPHVYSTALGG